MSVSIITNFKVNAYTPIDSRLVATNSAALNEIQYPYEGLTVFTKDRNLNYTYNGSVWQVSSNGIYGGSGSMVGSTDVNMGQVGSNTNDRAFELVLSASSSTSPDRAQFATSFIRNNNGTDFDTVEIRNQVRYIDNGSVLNGPYISFNKNDVKRGIISLGVPDRNFTTTVEKFRIEPDSANRNNGAIVLVPSTYSPPLTIGQNSRLGTFIGYNYDGRNKYTNGTASTIISFGGGRISFQSISSGINTLSDSILLPTEILRIGSVEGDLVKDEDFFQVSVDTAPGSIISPNSAYSNRQFLTLPSIIRDLEHRYTKTQFLSWNKTLTFDTRDGEQSIKQYFVDNGVVLLSNTGNFFDFELPVGLGTAQNPSLIDIKFFRIYDDEVIYDSPPPGTSITIRFTYEKSPIVSGTNYSSKILLWQLSDHTTRKIRASYADVNGGESIMIRHLGSTDAQDLNETISGDIITFMRGGDNYWYITNIQREKEILKKFTNTTLTWESWVNSPVIVTMTYVFYLRKNRTGYTPLIEATISDVPTTSIMSPNKYLYNDSNYLASEQVNIPLSIAKDTSGRVYMRGSFRINYIDFSALNKDINYGAMNTFLVGRIVLSGYRPPSSGVNKFAAWGYAEIILETYGSNPGDNGGTMVPGRIYVDFNGYISVQFGMMHYGALDLDYTTVTVNVPEWSYSTT